MEKPFNILGVANDETASACVLSAGRLIAAASEERFTRVKMDNSWPQNAINFCLREANLDMQDIDLIAYGWSAGFDAEKHLLLYFDRIAAEAYNNEGLEILRERVSVEISRDLPKRREFEDFVVAQGFKGRAVSIDYHEAHAYSAY